MALGSKGWSQIVLYAKVTEEPTPDFLRTEQRKSLWKEALLRAVSGQPLRTLVHLEVHWTMLLSPLLVQDVLASSCQSKQVARNSQRISKGGSFGGKSGQRSA